MTTGRINQVTIVRRGWPTAHVSGRKSVFVTGRTALGTGPRTATHGGESRPAARCPRREPRCEYPPSPSKFPRAQSAGTGQPYSHKKLQVLNVPPMRPERRLRPRQHPTPTVLGRRLSGAGKASISCRSGKYSGCEPPDIHRAHLAAVCRGRCLPAPSLG